MKRATLVLAAVALLLAVAGQTRAGLIPPGGGGVPNGNDPQYLFTFSDIQGDVGHGTLNAVPSGLGDGSLLVTNGELYVTSSSDGNNSVGAYYLVSGGPGITPSPNGDFSIDNLIYPANNAASGVNPAISSNPSFLTAWGLLFSKGAGELEVNIFGNGLGDYAFYTGLNGGIYPIQSPTGGTLTVAPTPEPASLTLLGLGSLGLLGYGWRRRKQAE
jgi:hypothetical protein